MKRKTNESKTENNSPNKKSKIEGYSPNKKSNSNIIYDGKTCKILFSK